MTDRPTQQRFAAVTRIRDRVRALPGGRTGWRIGVGVVGLAIIAVGIVLLPLPGPGWLIIFLGLGIWATEFEWASRLLTWARAQVKRWSEWIAAQSRPVQALIGLGGLVFLVAVGYGCWLIYRLV